MPEGSKRPKSERLRDLGSVHSSDPISHAYGESIKRGRHYRQEAAYMLRSSQRAELDSHTPALGASARSGRRCFPGLTPGRSQAPPRTSPLASPTTTTT